MTKTNSKEMWDLDKIYPSFHVWEKEFDKCKEEITDFIKYKKIIKSNLYEVISKLFQIDRNISKLFAYAHLNYDLDSLNDTNNLMMSKIQGMLDIYSVNTDFVNNEINKFTNKDLDKQFQLYDGLDEYRFIIENIRRNKKHMLSLKEENLLSLSGTIHDTQSRIFDKLNDSDSLFGIINGTELTHGNYHNFIISKDRNIREEAFTKYHEYYKNHSNSISECLITEVKNNILMAKIRKYSDPLSMYLDGEKVKPKIYDNMIKSVNNNLDIFYEFLKVRKNELNLEELHMYDLYVPLNEDISHEYSYEEAKDIVLESLKVMGLEYYNIAKDGLNNNWVDVYPSKGKTSGAYSSGTYDTKPYILLNYNKTLNSVETLAHELGHSMHSYYSRVTNPYQYSNYSILLAEIASNTHELLLFDYLLKTSSDKKMKKRILEIILNSFKSSIFRQTQFAEFEKIIHNNEQNNEPLTTNSILDIYYDLNKKYYGDIVVSDELIKYESLRIPHFYSSFYVYKYALGLGVAYIFAMKIINKEENAVNNYLKFIKSGGTNYPIDILKSCGIDLESKDVIDDALKIFAKYLEEYKKIM